MTLQQIEQLGKNEDALNSAEAVAYLASIGVRITARTLHNRCSLGTGPERSKRNGKLYFKKSALEAWKKQETEIKGAYNK